MVEDVNVRWALEALEGLVTKREVAGEERPSKQLATSRNFRAEPANKKVKTIMSTW